MKCYYIEGQDTRISNYNIVGNQVKMCYKEKTSIFFGSIAVHNWACYGVGFAAGEKDHPNLGFFHELQSTHQNSPQRKSSLPNRQDGKICSKKKFPRGPRELVLFVTNSRHTQKLQALLNQFLDAFPTSENRFRKFPFSTA